ncbi:hypothetical protein CJD36_012750 [Flavipsychrobacter stenotrophus]|uniref:DUF4271 domain-containing protein n=1 Tax=Flavipsychrobacter stenotrophus TaxID=2077091 RepID=A0A2S7SVB0_9BACT|nr:DUF4271 domain-containing protein [Flavipsychrobacter stenotrophus]PQJ10833.1 hypothetical protein CJD36_012750 [Flavipsychrobacter stenotrophus]
MRIVYLFLCFLLLFAGNATGKRVPLQLGQYNIPVLPDSAASEQAVLRLTDSMLTHNPLMNARLIVSDIQLTHNWESQTSDFYLLLSLCLLLGVIRYIDQRYFVNLWSAFWNPTLSNRQLKDQLQGAGFLNLLMNVFFAISVGSYMYYVVKFYTPQHSGVIPSSLLIIMLIVGTAIIYTSKYLAVRFSGWAFRVEGVTEHYLFNVFLINKILAIVLIPFIIILAFADASVARQMIVVSFIAGGLLLLNRYIRSWQVFGSFFQYSKFHFFMYLCASELLPLAVLMKLLVKGLMFY